MLKIGLGGTKLSVSCVGVGIGVGLGVGRRDTFPI